VANRGVSDVHTCFARKLWRYIIPALYKLTATLNIQNTLVTLCTTSLTFNISTFCIYVFVWICEQTEIIFLYSIKWIENVRLFPWCVVVWSTRFGRALFLHLQGRTVLRTASPFRTTVVNKTLLVMEAAVYSANFVLLRHFKMPHSTSADLLKSLFSDITKINFYIGLCKLQTSKDWNRLALLSF